MRINTNHIGIVFFLVIGVVPFFAAFFYALLYSFGLIGVLNDGFTVEHWSNVWSSGIFIKSFGYSAVVAFISLTLSVGLALWIVHKFKKELDGKFLSFVAYLPLAIPGVVAGFFVFQLLSKGGVFARLAYQLGFITQPAEFPDVVNDSLALGIIITFITLVTPFFVLLFLNVYKNARVRELSILARSLGSSENQITKYVFLPILLKKTWVLISLYFIFLMGAYEVPLILGQESPQMLSVLIVQELKQFDLTKIPEGYVVAVMYTLLVSTAVILLFLPKKKSTVHEN